MIGASLAPRALSALERQGLTETPQSDAGVTYAEKISAEEARIDWSRPAVDLDQHIRGLSPFPGAWFEVEQNEQRMRIKALMSSLASGGGAPGDVLAVEDGLTVSCGEGAVKIFKLQREGKAAQNSDAFLRGLSLQVGSRLA